MIIKCEINVEEKKEKKRKEVVEITSITVISEIHAENTVSETS